MSERIGQRLGNYQLVRFLGQGGFADVYLGQHQYLHTEAAIKVLRANLANDEVEGFLQEARTIGRLRHPHIVRVLEFGVEGNVPYLVMDYAPRGSLRQRHPRGTPLALETIQPYITQVASALHYAHEQKLIHRDVKPENMLLGPEDEVLLGDFGIAVVSQSSRYNQTVEVVGTISYMAPEQIQAHPRPASDQYALAVVAYEWLTGTRLFHGTFSEVAAKHLYSQPPALREQRPDLSPALEEVLLTALAKDPKARFASISAFASAFTAACQSPSLFALPTQPASVHAPPLLPPDQPPTLRGDGSSQPAETPGGRASISAPTLYPTWVDPLSVSSERAMQPPTAAQPEPAQMSPARKPERGVSRRAVLLSGLVGGVALAGGGLTWWVASRPAGQRKAAAPTHTPRPSVTATPPGPGTTIATYATADGITGLAWSPDSTRLVFRGYSKGLEIWKPLANERLLTLQGLVDTTEVYTIAWSRDGNAIASGDGLGNLDVWNASDGSTLWTHQTQDFIQSVVWSPDSTRLAFPDNTVVDIWNVASRRRVQRYTGHPLTLGTGDPNAGVGGNVLFSLSWSADGKRIASSDLTGAIHVWDPATAERLFMIPDQQSSQQGAYVAWSPDGKLLASCASTTVRLWDGATGASVGTIEGFSEQARCLAWSPDGRQLAVGTSGMVQVVNVAIRTRAFSYLGHQGSVTAVAWSPSGKYVASCGSDDQSVRVWLAT